MGYSADEIIKILNKETAIKCNEVKLTKEDCTIFDSKIGGTPYMPYDFSYPKTKENQSLMFLAQINFEQMPKLEHFPYEGILQFFILDDDISGLNLDDFKNQNTFRIIYHKNIDKNAKIMEVPQDCFINKYILEKDTCYKMNFNKIEMPITPTDFRFNTTCKKLGIDINDDNIDEVFDVLSASGHLIGGYPCFTQEDPREDENDDILLLQIDSEFGDEISIMWGDSGVANFFINKNDLENCDFTKVIYNWDCY